MIQRLVTVLILLPIAIVLITLAVANRAPVPFTLDPFHPGNPALTVNWPLFVYLFLALGIGMIIGSLATWWKQGYYRKRAKESSREIKQMRANETKTAKPGTALAAPSS